jgi:hypothetical protein
MLATSSKKVVRHKPNSPGVVHKHARKRQIHAARTGVHRQLARVQNEIGKVISRARPSQYPGSIPTTRENAMPSCYR